MSRAGMNGADLNGAGLNGARVLVLGGARLARVLADALADAGAEVTYSLAGVTDAPRLPARVAVRVRTGGFGGAEGLAAWLKAREIDLLADATHAFARNMPRQAARAARMAGVAALRVMPPALDVPEGLQVTRVADESAAAEVVAQGARVFAALGSRGLAALRHRDDLRLRGRAIMPPAFALPPRWRVVVGDAVLPPESPEEELANLRAAGAEWLILRESGTRAARNLLLAARKLGLRVVLIARPAAPAGVPVAHSVHEVLAALRRLSARPR